MAFLSLLYIRSLTVLFEHANSKILLDKPYLIDDKIRVVKLKDLGLYVGVCSLLYWMRQAH
ncbi:hypothetical protein T02_5507 [Trichinella nativa]|uniref:Uncharacterized protein n=1 Tax=Trichinella nativa TaxID=6335 RepID=A0A0V1LV72_9BILA|nr:hypothetical protein T06_13243 [Trichinella sp. T6]KRZ63074.1 hypothetical protein T02_5507 [Trichinella nativa]